MERLSPSSIHAIVTDPPYGIKEYTFDQIEKRHNGNGGIWRIPPAFDGHKRSPLPRFTALTGKELSTLKNFFSEWGKLAIKILKPGGHIFIATNAFLSQSVFSSLIESGLEYRGEIIRLVRTLRGGDRPKNAEVEFVDVCSMPRSCYEPWGLFRKPIPSNMKISDCLKEFETGGLRRKLDGTPFCDVIQSERTPRSERMVANHPSLKPQSFLRELVYASLPLGHGLVLDPFMGSGSTIAAAEAIGIESIGIERFAEYYELSLSAIPQLIRVETNNFPKQLNLTSYSKIGGHV
jgi:site-specific DNA-methyltransferase (adenine-specific)